MTKKRIYKYLIAVLAASLACLCFAGCELGGLLGDLLGAKPSVEQYPSTQMRVSIDYGFTRQGLATPLLGSCTTDFLDTKQWNLDVFLPGDVYVITHSGELIIEESYPGKVVLQKGQLISVNRIDAGIVKIQSDTKASLNAGVSIVGQLPQYVILNEQGAFCELSEYNGEAVLYATYERNEAVRQADGTLGIYPLALYAYAPRTTHTATFEARYDYGFHKLGKAEILMNDSTVFVDYELIAGDLVTVGYSGTMMIQETYPSTVVITDGGQIERVDVLQARLCLVKVVKDKDGGKMLVLENGKTVASAPDYVLTDPDGTYNSWTLYSEGTQLYASYPAVQGDEPTDLAGLYTYLPRK